MYHLARLWASWRGQRPARRSCVWVGLLTFVVWLHPAPLLQNLGKADPIVNAGLALAYGSAPAGASAVPALVELRIGRAQPRRELDARFVSFAIDSSQVLGGRFWSRAGRVEIGRGSERVAPFDFSRARLLELARALAPGYLRIGGTEADHAFYDFASPPAGLPRGYELALNAERWDALSSFARAAGFDLFFTVNAGPGPRDASGAWQADNAERLLAYAAEHQSSASVWELGNEVNAYWFIHGPSAQPSGARYAADLVKFRSLVRRYSPNAQVAGPASAFFPIVGEPTAWESGTLTDMLSHAGGLLDIVSWHYYPQQSRRCPVATQRAKPGALLEPGTLDEIDRWARYVEGARDRWAPGAAVWLGETGNAQCGGEPGISDRYEGGLWWLDQLGRLALRGQPVVIRQTLVGSEYGLLDDESLRPRPDYYNTLLWKLLMGRRVLEVMRGAGNPYLRLYAHCTPQAAGGVTLLAINLHPSLAAQLRLEDAPAQATAYALSAPSLASRGIQLDGVELSSDSVSELEGRELALPGGRLALEPASYTFLKLALDAPACDMPWPRLSDVSHAAATP